jgi:O-succinylbenzoate synthase
MALKASLHKKVFLFAFSARTSRGPMRDRTSWFFKIWDESNPEIVGLGECAPLAGLSAELSDEFELHLEKVIRVINESGISLEEAADSCSSLKRLNILLRGIDSSLNEKPSVQFALETCFLDLNSGGKRHLFSNSFVKGQPIPINGLIWMGGMDFMLQQIEIKIRDGFRCVKLKVGGLDFERECDILQYIRRKYFRDNIVVRLDANGALKPDEAMYKLKELSKYTVHSIEQPFKKGSDKLPDLCRESPIPVALDEELIGVNERSDKVKLLDRIKPQFIILKPSMHGGLLGCEEWIEIAKERNLGWWITSALESNIGLNAIAQFTSNFNVDIPQGLGTGQIYENNFESPLTIVKENLVYGKQEWDLSDLIPKKDTERLYL